MLSGSLALTLYAIPRATRDIEMIVELQDKHLITFIDAIKDKFYFHEPTIKEEIKRHRMFNIIHLEVVIKLILLFAQFILLKFKNLNEDKKLII